MLGPYDSFHRFHQEVHHLYLGGCEPCPGAKQREHVGISLAILGRRLTWHVPAGTERRHRRHGPSARGMELMVRWVPAPMPALAPPTVDNGRPSLSRHSWAPHCCCEGLVGVHQISGLAGGFDEDRRSGPSRQLGGADEAGLSGAGRCWGCVRKCVCLFVCVVVRACSIVGSPFPGPIVVPFVRRSSLPPPFWRIATLRVAKDASPVVA